MAIVEVAMTGVLMIEDEETIEIEVAQEMTEVEVAQGMIGEAIVETEVVTAAKMKTTPEMTGIVENVATLTSHSEQNVIDAEHQRAVAAEDHQNSGLVTIDDLAIETQNHEVVLVIGNVESARK